MARHQFAHVLPEADHPGGFVMVGEDGSIEFHPAARASMAVREHRAWTGEAASMSAARITAAKRFGPLDWHDVPEEEPDPVGWASLRAALALARG